MMDNSFFAAIYRHVILALTFRHDGSGLPSRLGAPLLILILAAVMFSAIRHLVFGTWPTVGSLIRYPLILMILFYIFNPSRYLLIAFYCCLSVGMDFIAIVAGLLFGSELKSGVFLFALTVWETAAFVMGIVHITKDRAKDR